MNSSDDLRSVLPVVVRLPEAGILFDLGEQPRGAIKELTQGRGTLCEYIAAAIERARPELEISNDKEIVPVLLLYRRADKPSGSYTVIKLEN